MTETIEPAAVLHGDAAIYTRSVLAIYDPIALGVMCPLVWKCSPRVMLSFYNRNVRGRHLDIGPGTGIFLDRCAFPVPNPSVVVADLNQNVLDTVRERIARYHPETLVRDALLPLDLGERRFESVGLLSVLHCLPGTMADKAVVFDNVRGHVEPGGRIFGGTVLGDGPNHTRLMRWMIGKYNQAGSFANDGDRLAQLHTELGRRFDDYRIYLHGAMAFFEIQL
ncbi:class I SAM-dependent methyltransferase [Kutzneria chonburiensis]|uniref:Class I SAM-dependent methyltransferase n=1 Tax=Kutzneria chonburiensis TaxID=1483604 RepID=A0ABV6MK11_9PSEU|nr:class I SAM-dependent methyltransferase [Kutzneria chonburiensis]